LALIRSTWYIDSGKALAVLFGLNCVPVVDALATRGEFFAPYVLVFVWFDIGAFLIWRVWRGGMNSWAILVSLNAWTLAMVLLGVVWPWGAAIYLVAASAAAQLALLCSPAVRRRLRTRRLRSNF
jgi:hypothetical protein